MMKASGAIEWTEARCAELRRRWAAGDSARVIGAALGGSKNAVVGKARRLGLERRPSPIRAPLPEVVKPRRLGGAAGPVTRGWGGVGKATDCQWIEGGAFCGRPLAPGRGSWCAEHRERVYQPAERSEKGGDDAEV